jgi:hypothetical protein
LSSRRNLTDGLLAFITDEDRQSDKYLTALKEKVPSVFKEFFGRYGADNSASANDDLLLDAGLVSNGIIASTLSENYYSPTSFSTTTTSTSITTLRTLLASSSSGGGMRSMLKNKTITGIRTFKQFYSQREEIFIEVVSIMENLPLYFTLSYLLMRYGLLFFDGLVGLCSNPKKLSNVCKRRGQLDDDEPDEESPSGGYDLDKMLSELDKGYKERNTITNSIKERKNSNYHYIKNLLGGLSLFDMRTPTEREESKSNENEGGPRLRISYVWSKFQKLIYKNVPFFRYSKQFINTFTVAFMVVYFFTLFGLRMSNVVGNVLAGRVYRT